MKKLIIILFTFSIVIVNVSAQPINQRVKDEKSKTEILVGLCDREGLLSCDFASSYNEEFSKYKLDDETINNLREKMQGVKSVIVLGTWCGDSKEQVPRFLKIVELAGIPIEEVKMIAVNRDKKTLDIDVKKEYSIDKVPTFIFYREEKEIGRITETPKKSLEKDLLEILSVK
jgi:thiol-disulfide isomerase/thioredoxin